MKVSVKVIDGPKHEYKMGDWGRLHKIMKSRAIFDGVIVPRRYYGYMTGGGLGLKYTRNMYFKLFRSYEFI